jgi:hypothetical protein
VEGDGVNNRWVLAAIVGQTLVTVVAIGYGVSAHSSWEAERQRRLDGERAAVAEMAAAMKAAGERLDKVEQELKRCRVRARRLTRPAALRPAPGEPAPAGPALLARCEGRHDRAAAPRGLL